MEVLFITPRVKDYGKILLREYESSFKMPEMNQVHEVKFKSKLLVSSELVDICIL